MKRKRGIFFSTDALLALAIIFFIILIAFPLIQQTRQKSEIHYDILTTLSSLKISEAGVNSSFITDPDNTVLEQIGEFYVIDQNRARQLADLMLTPNIQTNENIGLWYENTLVWSKNTTAIEDAENIDAARQIISGIQNGTNVTGFSARAFLSTSTRTQYFFFGGYIGDGNITANISYTGNISSATMEIASNKSFDLYINETFAGSLSGSSDEFTPQTYPLPTSLFSSGDNLIEFRGDNLHVAGGFIKITYETEVQYQQPTKYRFPGLKGLINLYDGFYIPEGSNLESLDISLHLESNFTTFLNIGNTTVFNGTTNGEETISIDNSSLGALLDYSDLVGKTIPLRLGLKNVSFLIDVSRVDVFSVTDISGSMDNNCPGGSADPGETPCGINDAKTANQLLIDVVLNNSGNRVGLIGYEDIAREADYHPLSDDNASLQNHLNVWDAEGRTCICCGINRAIAGFFEDSSGTDYIAYYPLDGDLADKSGNGQTATSQGNPSFVPGITGQAIETDGVDDYIDAGDLDFSSEGSVALWFKPTDNFNSASTTTQPLWGKYASDNDDAFIALRGSDMSGGSGATGTIQTKMEGPSGTTTYLATTTSSWTADNWYHITYTWGNDETKIYVNGLEENSASTSSSIEFSANDNIGRSEFDSFNLPSQRFFNGTIDDIRFYNKILETSEIQNIIDQSPTCGNDIIEAGEACDQNAFLNHTCSENGQVGVRTCNPTCESFTTCTNLSANSRSMIVMSDGQANEECSEQGTTADLNLNGVSDDAGDDAIQAACDANAQGIIVHSIAFGDNSDNQTMIGIASCGGGSFYFSAIDDLVDVYQEIANEILATFTEQTIEAAQQNQITTLFPDSFIEFTYTQLPSPFGLIITAEKPFIDAYTGTFSIPSDATVLETKTTSYSGARWTDNVEINNNSVYRLNNYGAEYISLGDPYSINIPISLVQDNNVVNLTTASSPLNSTVGSLSNKAIYTILKNVTAFSEISPSANGCIWHIEFEDNSNLTTNIPSTPEPTGNCFYDTVHTGGEIENSNDAFQLAVLDLLRELDLDGNDKIDIPFTEQDLQISLTEVVGIPFTYSTEVEARRWY